MKQHSTPQIGNAGRSRTLQALWLALANLLSLSVTLVMQAVLCRYMTTSEYGTYSQVLYVYNTLLAVFSLGLPKAYSGGGEGCRTQTERAVSASCVRFFRAFCFGRPPP